MRECLYCNYTLIASAISNAKVSLTGEVLHEYTYVQLEPCIYKLDFQV